MALAKRRLVFVISVVCFVHVSGKPYDGQKNENHNVAGKSSSSKKSENEMRSFPDPYSYAPVEKSGIAAQLLNSLTSWAQQKIGGIRGRSLRDVSKQMELDKWVTAYKKDPVSYQCIRKKACQTLATSRVAARSIESPLASAFLSILGYVLDQGNELRDIVDNTVGNPEICEEIVPWGLCEDDNEKYQVKKMKSNKYRL